MKTILIPLVPVMAFFLFISTGICQPAVTNGSFDGTTTGWDNCGLGSDPVPELKYSAECYDASLPGNCVQYGNGSGSDNNNCGTSCTGNLSPNYMAEVDQGNSRGLCQNITFPNTSSRTLYLTLGRRTDARGGGGAAATQIVKVCINFATPICTTLTRTSSSTAISFSTSAFTFTPPTSGTFQLEITNISTYSGPDNSNYGAIFSYIGFTPPLPIALLNFGAVKNGGKVDIEWQTATEKNNNYFIVEKSRNGVDFISVDSIDGSGTSQSLINYSTTDPAPYKGISYYRLKQVDYDGKSTFSKIVSVEDEDTEISIYPNPSQGSFKINVINEKQPYTIAITDAEGRLVHTSIGDSNNPIEINGLTKGVYVVRVIGTNTVVNRKLLVM